MKFSLNNFLMAVRNIVTGGGRLGNGQPRSDSGFAKRAEGVSLMTLQPSMVDSSGGTASNTVAVGVGIYQLAFPYLLPSIADGDLLTDYIVGHKFKILSLKWVTTAAASTGAKGSTITLEIGATGVTGIAIVLDSDDSTTNALGGVTTDDGTALNVGSSTATISIIAGSTTTFSEGSGVFIVEIQNMDTADAFATAMAQLAGTADETNAKVLKIEEAIDDIGHIVWVVPRDYDENTDILRLRVMASQVSLSTDDDVELDAEVYVKTAGAALGSDEGPTAPGTVLAAAEQWIEFDFKGYGLVRDQVVTIQLITDGHNDTDGEEVLIHAIELYYRSCLVSYDDEDDAEGQPLR